MEERAPRLFEYLRAMRRIDAGAFRMGSDDGPEEERPARQMSIPAFRIGATPATVAMWKEYCAATGTAMPEAPSWGWVDEHPMTGVSWVDLLGVDGPGGWRAWATDVSGVRLTLPTEAQWERAARGPGAGAEYPWGDAFDASRLWSSVGTARSGPAPVDRRADVFRTAEGVSDLAGNVWEWCLDRWDGEAEEDWRVLRGGCWSNCSEANFRCAARGRSPRTSRVGRYGGTFGFRLVAPG